MNRLVADVIVDVLRQAGVKRCYGIPGDTLNHICGSIHAATSLGSRPPRRGRRLCRRRGRPVDR